ncbi:MAG: zinc ribbon domain-containing protein [Deltaproteobacteria bacterium]|nr:zinc ribbon domain-containing protein [Deltaproteobacteria bacterium]
MNPGYCSQCGHALVEGGTFCSQCGHAATPDSPPKNKRRRFTSIYWLLGFLFLGSALLLYFTLTSPAPEPSSPMMETAADRLSPSATADMDYRSAIEQIFRSHPILGPKLVAVGWSAEDRATLHVKDFPMDSMPETVRSQFLEKMQTEVSQKLRDFNKANSLTVQFLDLNGNRMVGSFTATP